ncbi:hypothetical protein C8Q77DRAFT_678287 [Trametes polyzona]|nr:hypothetical protein C8Q77DRAFT_678287 [Trametes polyzona]
MRVPSWPFIAQRPTVRSGTGHTRSHKFHAPTRALTSGLTRASGSLQELGTVIQRGAASSHGVFFVSDARDCDAARNAHAPARHWTSLRARRATCAGLVKLRSASCITFDCVRVEPNLVPLTQSLIVQLFKLGRTGLGCSSRASTPPGLRPRRLSAKNRQGPTGTLSQKPHAHTRPRPHCIQYRPSGHGRTRRTEPDPVLRTTVPVLFARSSCSAQEISLSGCAFRYK